MNKKIVFISIICLFGNVVLAQMPMYKFGKFKHGDPVAGLGFSSGPGAAQSIYYGSDFPGVTSGMITSVYFHSGGSIGGLTGPGTYRDIRVKLGYTEAPDLPHTLSPFIQGLTTVFFASSVTFPNADSIGQWLKFPIDKTPFYYNPGRHLVVEVSISDTPTHGMTLITQITYPAFRLLLGVDSASLYTAPYQKCLEFGFDLIPSAAVPNPTDEKFEVLPNPANKFIKINCSGANCANIKRLSLCNLTGRIILTKDFFSGSIVSERQLDFQDVSPGFYFLKIWTNKGMNSKTITIK